MSMVLLALVVGVGAWMAWRRYPRYSSRSPAFMLKAIAVAIGVLAAVVYLVTYGSPTVVLITLIAVVVLGMFFMIVILPAITTPKEEQLSTTLPPSARVVHIHRHNVYIALKFLAVLLAICGILAMMPGDARLIGWVTGGAALALTLFGLLPLYFKARSLDLSLTALMCDPWFHWQYPPEQWKQWADAQEERTQAKLPKISRQREVFADVLIFAVIAVVTFIFYPGSSLIIRTLSALGLGGTASAYFVWKVRHDRGVPEKVRTALLKETREVYIGRDGLFSDGDFTTWLSMSIYLTSASIDESPPRSLIFRFTKFVGRNPYGLNFSSGYITVDRKVLIPPGAESDVARLQQELATRCPKAQIAIA